MKSFRTNLQILSKLIVLVAIILSLVVVGNVPAFDLDSGGISGESDFMLRPDDIIREQMNYPEGGDFHQLEINPEKSGEIITGSTNVRKT